MKRQKLLVANRSEIACRVFQTCREMGIATVGIFAPGDEEARHLTFADEIIGVDSYLNVESVVGAAKKTGTTLIHPGYGFLSERPIFAQAVEKADLTFVGPTSQTMEAMGGKITAKEIASKAHVPTLPYVRVEKGQGAKLKSEATKIGFPVLIKAASGGGGKGMRRVDRIEDLESAAEAASFEAEAAFGDGTLFLEKLVLEPRHIEVQVFGDGRGGGVHLRERECSLQRRHQKVWEEATAPHLNAKTREGLFESALSLVKAVKYRSAGTLEYLVDAQGGFYFLEMNTRLQVEHPVTELVTGVDLVRAQVTQALNPSGQALSHSPEARGHAIEVRLYAEDPSQGFRPTPGVVSKLRWPMGPGIRVDSGIEEGQKLGTSFDSMLGKLIVYAETREFAVARMREALKETVILGLGHNLSYLQAIAAHPKVIEGKVDTGLLERDFSKFKTTPSASDLEAAALISKTGGAQGSSASAGLSGSGAQAFPSPWFSSLGNQKGSGS